MLTVLLDTWPEIFLYPNDPNILFETVIWVIYNSGPSQSCTDMKVPEVKQKLCSFRIFGPKYNGDDLIKKLIEHVEKHHADKSGNMGDVKFSRNCIDFWTNSVKIMLSESTFNLKTNLDFAEKIIQVNLDLRQISIYLKIHQHTFFGVTGFLNLLHKYFLNQTIDQNHKISGSFIFALHRFLDKECQNHAFRVYFQYQNQSGFF